MIISRFGFSYINGWSVFIFLILSTSTFLTQTHKLFFFPSVTPAADNDQSVCPGTQNGPFSTCDPHPTNVNYSSDNDEDSGTENEALRKEMNRLREK